jgi:hypothetical protein
VVALHVRDGAGVHDPGVLLLSVDDPTTFDDGVDSHVRPTAPLVLNVGTERRDRQGPDDRFYG